MQKLLVFSPFLGALGLGLALGVITMIRGIDRHLQRRGRVSPLSMPTMAAFFTVAGAVGYPVARYGSLEMGAVVLIAVASGLAAAAGAYALIAGWAVPSAASDEVDPRFLLQGHFGRVTKAIAAGEAGEIVYEHDGEQQRVAARALDDKAIPQGAEVVIERVEDGVAHVELWSTIANELRLPA
ncbi:MAG TPA: hypothetical protein VFS05_00730 [Gemmatimonadaceae bacterium]|nr:hypothetical protein [Gemmatimonadaceae bacterium]